MSGSVMSSDVHDRVRIYVIRLRGDNPKLSTALKLVRLGLAIRVSPKTLPHGTVVLDPTAKEVLTPWDRGHLVRAGLTVIDASWNRGVQEITSTALRVKGFRRVLPPLKAGNPINYGIMTKLSSAEAIAAALIITGYRRLGESVISKFKWGHTFLELNNELLRKYSRVRSVEEMLSVQEEVLRKYLGKNKFMS